MLKRISKRKIKTVQDEGIHIVGLWNLMVILIPFLLLSAFVSETSILNLYVPSVNPDQGSEMERRPLVIVRISGEGFKIQKGSEILSPIPLKNGQYDFNALSEILWSIKKEYPEQDHLTILSDPMVSYENLIQVMDASREKVMVQDGKQNIIPLFPDISIGEAQNHSPNS